MGEMVLASPGLVAHVEYLISCANDYSRQFSNFVVTMLMVRSLHV